jgi:hypothetical protein
MDDSKLDNFLNPFVNQFEGVFEKKSGQFMLVSPDESILNNLIKKIKKLKNYNFVNVKKDKDLSPNNKVFLISLNSTSSMEYQSLLYYYFELPLHFDCFVCILTDLSNSLNIFEKRVMSRFKNKIFFIPYYIPENSNKFSIHSSIESQNREFLIKKYDFDQFSLKFLLDLFEPLHIAIIIMSFSHKINIVKVYDQFKLVVLNTPELKKASPIKVLRCALEVMESSVMSEKGTPLINYNEFKEYVRASCPLYLKLLLNSVDQTKRKN